MTRLNATEVPAETPSSSFLRTADWMSPPPMRQIPPARAVPASLDCGRLYQCQPRSLRGHDEETSRSANQQFFGTDCRQRGAFVQSVRTGPGCPFSTPGLPDTIAWIDRLFANCNE